MLCGKAKLDSWIYYWTQIKHLWLNRYTFHCPSNVMGQIIRFPPLISGDLDFSSLLESETPFDFLGPLGNWSEIWVTSLAASEASLPEEIDEPSFLEWLSRRAIVIIVFPSPIASARIFNHLISVKTINGQKKKKQHTDHHGYILLLSGFGEY